MPHDVRKPPVGAVLRQHPQGVRGTCGWCGKPCEDKTPGRGWLKWYHDACSLEMAIIERPDQARRSVLERDKGICCDCGEDWSERFRLIPVKDRAGEIRVVYARSELRPSPPWEHGAYWISALGQPRDGHFPFVEVNAVSLWHVDHKVPLWKVRDLPDLARLEYFKLPNLITRCHRCHQFKTDEEAAERAKFNRLAEPPPDKPKASWGTRSMGKRPPGTGNGFPPKGSTPMRKKS